MTRRLWALLFALCGFSLGMTNLLAPIHEFYHIAVAGTHGIDATMTGWNTSTLARFNSPAMFAGWSSNVWSGVVIAVAFALIGRHSRARFFTGAGGLAYAAVGWGRAYSSWDFNGAIKEYVATMTDNSQIQYHAWTEIHQDIVIRWTAMGLILLLIALIVVLLNLKEKAARGGPISP